MIDRRAFLAASTLLGCRTNQKTIQAVPSSPISSIVKPKRLSPGNTVALINPAGAVAYRVDIEIVVESLEAIGLKVKLGKHLMDRYGYLAGTDIDRAADVNEFFADPEVDGILAVRGGWGCARILPLIDYDSIRSNPKVLLGYSDVTALLLAIHSKTGLVTFHGPVGKGSWNDFSTSYVRSLLFEGEPVTLRNPEHKLGLLTQVEDRIETICLGKAKGRLLGGNLTVLSALIGSGYLPDWDGAVLFVEEVGEYIYRVDRMLTQLKLAGILDRLSGFVFGKCTDCKPGGEGFGSLTLEQVFDDHIRPLNIPAWYGSMIGHISNKFTIPVGVEAEIDAETGTIQLIEPAVL